MNKDKAVMAYLGVMVVALQSLTPIRMLQVKMWYRSARETETKAKINRDTDFFCIITLIRFTTVAAAQLTATWTNTATEWALYDSKENFKAPPKL